MSGSPLAFFGTVPDGYAGHCAKSDGTSAASRATIDNRRTTGFIRTSPDANQRIMLDTGLERSGVQA